MQLTAGQPAPDFEYITPWQESGRLSDLLQKGDVALFFLRYVGCPLCRMAMADIAENASGFERKGVAGMVVLQSPPESVRQYFSDRKPPFQVACDPDSSCYRRYGVATGSIFQYAAPAAAWTAFRAFRSGFRHGRKEGRELQLPAVFIVRSDGSISYAHYGRHVADIPESAQLLQKI